MDHWQSSQMAHESEKCRLCGACRLISYKRWPQSHLSSPEIETINNCLSLFYLFSKWCFIFVSIEKTCPTVCSHIHLSAQRSYTSKWCFVGDCHSGIYTPTHKPQHSLPSQGIHKKKNLKRLFGQFVLWFVFIAFRLSLNSIWTKIPDNKHKGSHGLALYVFWGNRRGSGARRFRCWCKFGGDKHACSNPHPPHPPPKPVGF